MQEINELDDFDILPASYEVWVLGYSRFDIPTGFELLFGNFEDPDAAVELAKAIATSDIVTRSTVSDDVSYFSIEVETVVFDHNAGTVYRRCLENKKPVTVLQITEADYELTEEGNLKLKNSVPNVGDYVNAVVVGKPDAKAIPLKVIYKEANIIICEFID